jgi:integrase
MKTQIAVWPKTVTVGNSSVKVYKRITASGNDGFQVVYRDENSKRKFDSYPDEVKAMREAENTARKLSTFGARVASVAPVQIAELVTLSDRLKPFAVELRDGVQSLANWLASFKTLSGIDAALNSFRAGGGAVGNIKAVSVADAVIEFLKFKRERGASDDHVTDMEWRLNKLAEDFKCDVATINTQSLQAWLNGLKLSAGSYEHYRRVLSVFFIWCVRASYHSVNPVKGSNHADTMEKRKVPPTTTRVYSPADLQQWIAATNTVFNSKSKELKANCAAFELWLVVGGFAGVRRAEFLRLRWQDFKLEESYIVLDAKITKTAKRRMIPIQPNLRAWLASFEAHAKQHPKELIWLDGDTLKERKLAMRAAQEKLEELAGMKWRKNALRHSFCSYRLAMVGDASKVSDELGDSAAIIQTNYKALVTLQAAREWFAIMPPAATSTDTV